MAWIAGGFGGDVRDVQEAVLVLVLLVYRAHQRGSGWQHLVDEDEDGLFRRQLDALTNHIDELADRQVCGDKVLLLVDGRDVRLFDLFADDLAAVSDCAGKEKGVGGDIQECGRCTFGGCALPRPCASQTGARP